MVSCMFGRTIVKKDRREERMLVTGKNAKKREKTGRSGIVGMGHYESYWVVTSRNGSKGVVVGRNLQTLQALNKQSNTRHKQQKYT
ncbi:MAG: hypothetical protein ABSF44_12355 [Candidatus Bathyarchaeia archaeon]